MPDREKIFDAIRNCITEPKCRDCPGDECEKFDCKKVSVPVSLMLDALKLLKEQEAVKPRVSSVEQRCGNCNKVIEMDGWEACPWCGRPILWEAVGRSVKRDAID